MAAPFSRAARFGGGPGANLVSTPSARADTPEQMSAKWQTLRAKVITRAGTPVPGVPKKLREDVLSTVAEWQRVYPTMGGLTASADITHWVTIYNDLAKRMTAEGVSVAKLRPPQQVAPLLRQSMSAVEDVAIDAASSAMHGIATAAAILGGAWALTAMLRKKN